MIFDGTPREFEALVEENKLLLYSIVYGIAGSHDADDIVQETFIHAYYNFGALRDRESLRAWLCAIARNKALDSVKKASRTVSLDAGQAANAEGRGASRSVFPDGAGPAAAGSTPESLVIRREERSRLMAEISALSPKYRETVLLYYFAGKSIREISGILSVPSGTVKFRLSEGRKKLKKELIEMINEEKTALSGKDIFTQIRQTIDEAEKAMKKRDTKRASDLCDPLLERSWDLKSLSSDELGALYGLYSIKERSIRYAEGIRATRSYLEKQVEVAEASGDAAWISGAYSFYAAQLSNMGRGEESSKYYALALEKALETGQAPLIADRLYWRGLSAYQNREEDYGLSFFEKVLSMKAELLSGGGNEISKKTTYALAYSAARAIKGAGDRISGLDAFESTAPSVSKAKNGLYLVGQQGFCLGDYLEDVFYEISRIEPFLSDGFVKGHSFEANGFSYSHLPVRTRLEVVATDEEISVPAGNFKNCLHTRYTSHVAEGDKKLNKETNGTRDIWYAPGVGVVKTVFVPILGDKSSLVLKSCSTAAETATGLSGLYLPLAVGNQWEYETLDRDGAPLSEKNEYENLFEVVCEYDLSADYGDKHGRVAVIAHSGWGLKREQAPKTAPGRDNS